MFVLTCDMFRSIESFYQSELVWRNRCIMKALTTLPTDNAFILTFKPFNAWLVQIIVCSLFNILVTNNIPFWTFTTYIASEKQSVTQYVKQMFFNNGDNYFPTVSICMWLVWYSKSKQSLTMAVCTLAIWFHWLSLYLSTYGNVIWFQSVNKILVVRTFLSKKCYTLILTIFLLVFN